MVTATDYIPANLKLERACTSVINNFAVNYNITYDGSAEGLNYKITVMDITNNLYTIEWEDLKIIANQAGLFVNQDVQEETVSLFLSDITCSLNKKIESVG